MMTKNTLIASHTDALDTLSALAAVGFDTIERAGTLSLDYGRANLEDSAKVLSDLAAVREPKALLALGASLVAPALSRNAGYLRTSYAIASVAGESINALLAPKYASINKDLDKAIEALSVNTPVAGEVIATALKSAMTATNSAIEDAAKTTRKVVEMTESNINKATDAAVKSAAKAAKKVA